jgi:hypothetical protein
MTLPCCQHIVHEECLCNTFYDRGDLRCPHCPQQLYPVNEEDPWPTPLEGFLRFRLERFVFNIPAGMRPVPPPMRPQDWERVRAQVRMKNRRRNLHPDLELNSILTDRRMDRG